MFSDLFFFPILSEARQIARCILDIYRTIVFDCTVTVSKCIDHNPLPPWKAHGSERVSKGARNRAIVFGGVRVSVELWPSFLSG